MDEHPATGLVRAARLMEHAYRLTLVLEHGVRRCPCRAAVLHATCATCATCDQRALAQALITLLDEARAALVEEARAAHAAAPPAA